jgi:hypothetical protein
METKQLELFSENDFEPQKTYIRKVNEWVIIDNLDRSNFEATRKIHYRMIIDITKGIVHNDKSIETTPLDSDKSARKITTDEYFMLACLLKEKGNFIYNKKLGKSISK